MCQKAASPKPEKSSLIVSRTEPRCPRQPRPALAFHTSCVCSESLTLTHHCANCKSELRKVRAQSADWRLITYSRKVLYVQVAVLMYRVPMQCSQKTSRSMSSFQIVCTGRSSPADCKHSLRRGFRCWPFVVSSYFCLRLELSERAHPTSVSLSVLDESSLARWRDRRTEGEIQACKKVSSSALRKHKFQ